MPRFLWTQKQDLGPKPRAGHAMTYDSNRQRIVLFGGDSISRGLFSDTWEWDGSFWTQTADMGISARRDHAMAYDAGHQRVTVFGGTDNHRKLADTWIWEGENWTQVSNTGPQARSGHALVYNRVQQKIILFGGESVQGVLGDTWEFDGDEWTQVEDTGPAARKFHAMSYDGVRDRVVLFGGTEDLAGLGDTWEWNGSSWVQVADFGPAPCLSTAMVAAATRIVLFGGVDSTDPALAEHALFDNSWEWDGEHWTQRQDIGPSPRWGHAMSYDQNRSTIVIFGGSATYTTETDGNAAHGLMADTWEHADASAPEDPPPTDGVPVVVELDLNPNPVSVSQVGGVTVSVTLSGRDHNGLVIPLGGIAQTAFESGLPDVVQIPGVEVHIEPNEISGQTQLPQGIASESFYVVALYDPTNSNNYVYSLLTVMPD